MTSSTAPIAPSRRGDPIYISSFIERNLASQIIPTLRNLGMRPIALKEPLRYEEPFGFLKKRIAACRGGVLRLSEDWYNGQELEIREGLKHFPRRMLIISEPQLLDRPPPDVEPRVLFPVTGSVMSPHETEQFASILSRRW